MSPTPVYYFIIQTLWSNAQRRNLMPGERAELDDLTEEQIAKLTAANVIMLYAPPADPLAAQLADNPEPPAAKKPHRKG